MPSALNAIFLTSLLLSMRVGAEEEVRENWANAAGHPLSRSCMYGFGISGFYSVYDMAKKDRLWRVRCSRLSFSGGDFCWWTYEMVNELKENFKFNCENNSYISGVYSDYDTVTSDRTWRVECCRSEGIQVLCPGVRLVPLRNLEGVEEPGGMEQNLTGTTATSLDGLELSSPGRKTMSGGVVGGFGGGGGGRVKYGYDIGEENSSETVPPTRETVSTRKRKKSKDVGGDVKLPNCVETDFVNESGSLLEFYVPANKALRGIYSYYDQKIEDRRWRYHICDMADKEKETLK